MAQTLSPIKSNGKNLPNSEQQKAMAAWIFADGSRHSKTYTLAAKGSKPALNIHYIARHGDVMDILRGPFKDHISLAHYDDLIRSATPDMEFVLGAPSPGKTERWEILRRAFDHPPKMRRTDTQVFDAIAQRAVDKALDTILHISGTDEKFNAVKDYSYLVPYLVAAELTGLAMPEKPTLLLRLATAIRNKGKSDKVKLKGLSIQSEQLLLWSQMIFGHAFTNIGDRIGLLRFGDRYASGQYVKAIRYSMSEKHTPAAGSLIARFQAVRHHFPEISEDDYDQHIINTVYEIAGTVVILAGTSFANILSTLQEKEVSIVDYVSRVRKHGVIALDEAMRLTPTTGQLYRRVKTDFNLHGTDFKVGDMICMMLSETMRDADAFPQPELLSDFSEGAPKRNNADYLNFGPNEVIKNPFNPKDGTHPCFGQYWARDMLHKMLEGLTQLPEFALKAPLGRFLTLPDSLPATFTMPAHIAAAQSRGTEPSQNLYTFCTEVCGDLETRLERDTLIIKEIEKLGNPASEDARKKILATNCIHFMSLSVISGDNKSEPSYLVMEMGADGDEDDVINALCKYFGEELYHIYKKAGCVKKREAMVGHLQDHAIELAQSSWPEFLSGKRRNGLGFSGTAGLASDRIRAEDTLAEFAIDTISKIDSEGEGTGAQSPQQILETVRSALSAPEIETSHPNVAKARWTLENSTPPNYAEKVDSEWNLGGGLPSAVIKMFPRNFIAYFGLLYLAVTALVSLVLFGGASKREQLCAAAKDAGCRLAGDSAGTNLLSNPVGLEEIPNGLGTLFIYHSPLNIAFALFMAFLFSMGAAIIARKLRNGLDNVYSLGFARMGSIFWFIFGLVIFIAYQSAYPYLPESLQIKLLNARGLQFFRIGLYPWFWALGFTIVFAGMAIIKKRVRPERSLSAILTTFMMAITTLSIGINQLRLMGAIDGPVTDFTVLNRWADAGLQHLIFYPLLLSIILTAAVYAFSLSFPKFNFMKNKAVLAGVFASFFTLVFVTTFFSWKDVTGLTNSPENWALSWIFVPLFASTAMMITYLVFNRYIIGKKFTVKAFWKTTVGLAVLISLAIHLDRWATTRLGETLIAFILAIPVTLFFIAAFVGLLYALIRASEIRNKPHDAETQTSNLNEIMSRENNVVAQNHMISVVRLVPEQFRRRFTLPLALNIILEGLKNHSYRPGFLGSIGTVHYARWVHLPKTNNYVFYSNYDGSFENYLEDFITKASFGLTGAWSHSVGFPETNLLFLKGSQDGDRFKRYARGSMIPTPFWFSAYPNISAEQIRRNALIRDGIARIDSPSDAEAWLDLFGSRTRPAHTIQTERIQSLMFTGAGKLKAGACLRIHSNDPDPEPGQETDNFKNWVRDVLPSITFGETSPAQRASYIAFAKGGLARLGLGTDLTQDTAWTGAEELMGETPRTKFPPVLSLGMDNKSRKNILGDAETDAPEHWDWGTQEKPCHAVLLVYAVDQADLKKLIKTQTDLMSRYGLSSTQIDFEDLKKGELAKEPFGFVDGVSQPILRGTRRAAANADSHHLVNPGEFILGYKDNRDYYPPSPQVEAIRDGARDLPATVQHQPQRYPKFEPTGSNTLRDLGRNGSYLVIRQLEQDVKDFHAVTKEIAKGICPVTGSPAKDKKRLQKAKDVIQAKMMGRWQDGRSLMENPVRIHRETGGHFDFEYKEDLDPTWTPENEFLFGQDDPQGHACPYGSHIRRANPRDGLETDSADALGIVNRHRILRRGRSYIQGNKKGTFFMCLNADIDRQFEFVQQTWVASSKFHGLRKEVDPITAQGIHKDLASDKTTVSGVKDNLQFTIQAPGQEIPITGLKSFVTMKGGGYFFMPGRDALRFLSS
ncbi:MAG: cytochrome P450 [Hellea sp.]